MMKVYTQTWYRGNNYGSVLQAYALQHIIMDMGYESSILNYKPTKVDLWKLKFFVRNICGLHHCALLRRKLQRYAAVMLCLSAEVTKYGTHTFMIPIITLNLCRIVIEKLLMRRALGLRMYQTTIANEFKKRFLNFDIFRSEKNVGQKSYTI